MVYQLAQPHSCGWMYTAACRITVAAVITATRTVIAATIIEAVLLPWLPHMLLLLPQTYLRNEGVKSLSYNAAGRSQIAGGDSVQDLEAELAASSRRHDQPGLVSIVVREATERPIKVHL
jgi:hypothetical protein